MLRYVLYPAFGLAVLGGYAASAVAGVDATSLENVQRGRLPSQAGQGNYESAPMIWHTGFHGPGARVVTGRRSSGRRGYYGGGGGFFGGYGGGK